MSYKHTLSEFANKPAEVHSFSIGTAVGLFAGLLRDTGYEKYAFGLLGGVLAIAFGIRGAKKYVPVKLTNKDVKNEPHYAISGTVLGFITGSIMGMYFEF